MRQAVNILFLGGAKRVSMARMFQASGERLGLDVNIFSYELSPEAPIAEVATVIPGRRWSDPELMEDLHNAVGENRIDIMVPFVDPAVEVAARYCASDACCSTPGVDGEMASLLFDKVASDELFRQNGFPCLRMPWQGGVDGKVIAKPRCGSASKGIMVLGHEDFQRMAGRRRQLRIHIPGVCGAAGGIYGGLLCVACGQAHLCRATSQDGGCRRRGDRDADAA